MYGIIGHAMKSHLFLEILSQPFDIFTIPVKSLIQPHEIIPVKFSIFVTAKVVLNFIAHPSMFVG